MTTKTEKLMAEAAEIKDPQVAVHLARIEGRLEAVKVSSDQLSTQLATMITQLQDLSKLSVRYEGHDASVKRIWEELDRRHSDRQKDLVVMQTTDARVSRILWFTGGMSFVSGLLISVLLWIANSLVFDIKNLDHRADRVEIYLAGPKTEPYKR